jgi:hypothetical protein
MDLIASTAFWDVTHLPSLALISSDAGSKQGYKASEPNQRGQRLCDQHRQRSQQAQCLH